MSALAEAAHTRATNPLDEKMTAAQLARRDFKSSLPRKILNLRLSPMAALGQTFILLDRFRALAEHYGADPELIHAELIHAELIYFTPTVQVATFPVPNQDKLGAFCDAVNAAKGATFLGVLFIHTDREANPGYHTVSFVAQFIGGPEAVTRMKVAQQRRLLELEQMTLERISKSKGGKGKK
jgi:hypothetical protein